jgi:predicted nucleic acid-binding protein
VIVLDTNVISELMHGSRAHPRVLSWARSMREQPATTSLNRAELLAGAAVLPPGRRRNEMVGDISRTLAELGPPLPFTADCATVYAEIFETRKRAGRPIGTMDALIAAVAKVNRAAIATRDVDGFAGIGLTVLDPWGDR